MLFRVTYMSEAVGTLGKSVLSIAHIIGVSEPNNRRDGLTSAFTIHEGRVLQVVEGARADLDRLLFRLKADPRHTRLTVLSDRPVSARLFSDPMAHCRIDQVQTGLDLNAVAEAQISAEIAETLLAACLQSEDTERETRNATYG